MYQSFILSICLSIYLFMCLSFLLSPSSSTSVSPSSRPFLSLPSITYLSSYLSHPLHTPSSPSSLLLIIRSLEFLRTSESIISVSVIIWKSVLCPIIPTARLRLKSMRVCASPRYCRRASWFLCSPACTDKRVQFPGRPLRVFFFFCVPVYS